MNNADFIKFQQFPADSETWDFVKEMAHMAAKLTALGGQNYILSGCEVTGTAVSAGLIVINGELLPFTGGTLASGIIIQETRESVEYLDINYPELYIRRVARFGTGDPQYNWSDFKRITDLLSMRVLVDGLKTSLSGLANTVDRLAAVPTGVITPFAAINPPDGWMICAGQTLQITDYPKLFGVIGITYGGNGTTNFKIPDLSGRVAMSKGAGYNIGVSGGAAKVKLKPTEQGSIRFRTARGEADDSTDGQGVHALEINGTTLWHAKDANGNWLPYGGWSPMKTARLYDDATEHENLPPYIVLNYIIKI